MRIPLDYYRILGIPIQASPEQIQQAHSDRLQQLPRYQYSSAALTARKQLLEEAYATLSDPEQRQSYDRKFLSQTYALDGEASAPEETTPSEITSIEIQEHQLGGALLLLYELGEYDLVLQVGKPYLLQGKLDLRRPYVGSTLAEADIVLSVALTDMELGREQWQQGYYEKAAQVLQEGLDLLVRENLFADAQGQIRADLDRLRPYRILELLALPLQEAESRTQGLTLLQAMLMERGGIDGTGNDQSGLDVDSFLQFIQQLRSYLTVAEQQELFEAEARRPSAVGTYLAVYALIARGFAEQQPALIRRAKAMLRRLSIHQDVYLEQASCMLLLGQTEEALQALEQTHDAETLAFIRQASEQSPDLLPGLYHYTERWLGDEVYPYFRDLNQQAVVLKDYFANEEVQHYLEALEGDVVGLQPSSSLRTDANPALSRSVAANNRSAVRSSGLAVEGLSDNSPEAASHPVTDTTTWSSSSWSTRTGGTTLMDVPTAQEPPLATPWDLPQVPLPPLSPPPSTSVPSSHRNGSASALNSKSSPSTPNPSRSGLSRSTSRNLSRSSSQSSLSRTSRSASHSTTRAHRSRRRPGKSNVLVIALLLLGLGLVGWGVSLIVQNLWSTPSPDPSPTVSATPVPLLDLTEPPVPIPAPRSGGVTPQPIRPASASVALTPETAKTVIQDWQRLKAEALGQEHTIANLDQILAEPALSRWRSTAQQDRSQQIHWKYQLKDLKVESVTATAPEQVEVVAEIDEIADYYANGQRQPGVSYTDSYRVRYILVRQRGQWLIKDMKVIG
uniref:Heat shock protein DnaJ domain protein n=1 Tax=Cyanothece sp. (strain PCC 7425 / ATCC 29141) TaxID=395961 RepID=B8HXT2_CYAP4